MQYETDSILAFAIFAVLGCVFLRYYLQLRFTKLTNHIDKLSMENKNRSQELINSHDDILKQNNSLKASLQELSDRIKTQLFVLNSAYASSTLTYTEIKILNDWVHKCHELDDYKTLNFLHTEILHKNILTDDGFKTFHILYEFEIIRQDCLKQNEFLYDSNPKTIWGFNANIDIFHKNDSDQIELCTYFENNVKDLKLQYHMLKIGNDDPKSSEIMIENGKNYVETEQKYAAYGCRNFMNWDSFINDGYLCPVDNGHYDKQSFKVSVVLTIQLAVR
jgi:hypothetical protein